MKWCVSTRRLAAEPVARGEFTLNRALEAASRRATHDHLVVLISDLDGADDETRRLATLLAAHNDVLAVLTYDPLGACLAGQPGMMATDRGSRWEIPSGAGFTDSFRQVFADKLDEWTDIFRALRVPVIPVSTAEPVAQQLRTLFGERLARDERSRYQSRPPARHRDAAGCAVVATGTRLVCSAHCCRSLAGLAGVPLLAILAGECLSPRRLARACRGA